MAYVAEYQRPYEGGYVNKPDESTPEMAEFINKRDDTLLKIEQFLANLDLSGLGSDYALLSEAGYSLGLDINENYIMTISIKNKAGAILDSKSIDFPIESSIIDIDYADGNLILTLQNGNSVSVGISDIVRGLVPTTRKIAGIDLADDITKEELKDAIGIYDDVVSAGEIKPWLYKFGEEEIVGVYNGKPLYQKTFVYNNVAVSSGVASSSNISITLPLGLIDVDKVFIDNAYGVDSGYVYPFPYAHNNPISCVAIFIEGDYQGIAFRFGTEFSATVWSEIVINLKYTKTTDAEGSGNDLKPYGIYDAKLDDIKAEIDEVKNAITETTETSMPNSHEGRFLFKKIGGVCEQGENPSPTNQQEIKNSVVSGVKTHGKNFVQFSDGEDAQNGVTAKTENGVITLTGTPTVESGNILGIYAKQLYSNSFEDGVKYYAKDCYNRVDMADGSKQYFTEFTFNKNTMVSVQPYVQIKVSDYVNGKVLYPMLTTEPNAEFEPYKESAITFSQPIELYEIGDVKDVIEDGKVKEKCYKQEFVGTENIAESSTYFSIPLEKQGVNGSVLCNIDSIARITTNYARITKYDMTLDEFKAYLVSKYGSGNPAYIIYPLAEEVTEDLPLADQIALNSLVTFDGITYLEFDSEIKPTFEGEYGTSKHGGYTLESLLTARNNDLRLSSLEATVVNNI